MRVLQGDGWKRRGISLLWGSEALAALAPPREVVSIRRFFAMEHNWPSDLPSNRGNALVVAGLEGCLDLLEPDAAKEWLETELRPTMLAFQNEFNMEAALLFWLPTGRNRVRMNRATEAYSWVCAAPHPNQQIDFGRILWAGAEADAGRIIDPYSANADPDGPAWIGLHHPRVS